MSEDMDFGQPVEEGDEVVVTIEDMGSKGDGIARIEGFVIFVPETDIGETVKIEIDTVGSKFAFGKVVEREIEEEEEGYEKEEIEEPEAEEGYEKDEVEEPKPEESPEKQEPEEEEIETDYDKEEVEEKTDSEPVETEKDYDKEEVEEKEETDTEPEEDPYYQ